MSITIIIPDKNFLIPNYLKAKDRNRAILSKCEAWIKICCEAFFKKVISPENVF